LQTSRLFLLTVLLGSCGSPEVVKAPSASAAASPESPKAEVQAAPSEPGVPSDPSAPSAPSEPNYTGFGDEKGVHVSHDEKLLEWTVTVERHCGRTKNLAGYLPRRDWMTPQDTELLKKRCEDAVEFAMRGAAWREALRACLDRYVAARGAGKFTCRLAQKDVPEVPPALFDKHLESCNSSCISGGPVAIEHQKEMRERAWCCDGTRSTCTNGALGAHCCVGHRGVCLE
jgi:hypothetical protein